MTRSSKLVYMVSVALLGCGGEPPARASDTARGATTVAAPVARPVSPVPTVSATNPVIVFAGTSLTAGLGLEPDSAYPQLVQRKIDSAGWKYRVVNAGVSGETSSGLLRRMDWLMRQPFSVFVIETGANDGLRGIPVATMDANIRAIIARVRAVQPQARIALVQMEAPPNLGMAYTRQFRETFPRIAREEGVTLIPFLLDGVAGVAELNQNDGIHPNYEGARLVAGNVWKALKPLL